MEGTISFKRLSRKNQRTMGSILCSREVIDVQSDWYSLILFPFGCLHKIYCIVVDTFLTSISGDFAFKQNEDILPTQQMVICVPDIRVVSVTEFFFMTII